MSHRIARPPSPLVLAPPRSPLRYALARALAIVLALWRSSPPGGEFQHLLRHPIIGEAGATPTAYGWHVDDRLHCGLHSAPIPLGDALAPPPAESAGAPPDVGFRVTPALPRRRHPAPGGHLAAAPGL